MKVKDFIDKLIVNDGYMFHCCITTGKHVEYADYAGDNNPFDNIPEDIRQKTIVNIELEQSVDDHQTFITLTVK